MVHLPILIPPTVVDLEAAALTLATSQSHQLCSPYGIIGRISAGKLILRIRFRGREGGVCCQFHSQLIPLTAQSLNTEDRNFPETGGLGTFGNLK